MKSRRNAVISLTCLAAAVGWLLWEMNAMGEARIEHQPARATRKAVAAVPTLDKERPQAQPADTRSQAPVDASLQATSHPQYAFLTDDERRLIRGAVGRGVDCLLKCQLNLDGRRAGWTQQYDAFRLTPVAARSFEPAELSTAESANILVFLMLLDTADEDVVRAVSAGCEWLRSIRIDNAVFEEANDTKLRSVIARPGGGPIWPRFWSARHGVPVFGDRDGLVYDGIADLSKERRNGYAWYSSGPNRALSAYDVWRRTRQ